MDRAGILTNGVLINSEIINFLEKINPKFVAISLDSIDDEKYKKIRGVSNKGVINNIIDLKSRGIRVRINIVIFKGINDSYHDIYTILKFLKEYGFTRKDVAIDEFLEIGRGSNHYIYSLDKNEAIKNIKKAFENVFGSDYLLKPSYIESGKNKKSTFCGLGESIAYLNSKGNLTLCTVLNDDKFSLGNILKTPVKEIWEDSKLLIFFRKNKHIKNTKCEDCEHILGCGGGCKAKTMLLKGKFNEPDEWMCKFFGV